MSLNINACYVAAEIPNTAFNKESFEEVKKILLLELKASGGDYLMIENEPYSKQDLLDYFENVHQEFFVESGNEVPEVTLSSENTKTWHSPLSDPISIMHVFDVPNELMDPNKQEEAKVLVEKLYGPKIIQVCQQQFKDKNFDQLQFLLSYDYVFSSNLAHEIKRNLSILFKNLCLSIRMEIDENPNLEDVENSLFFQSSFYHVLFFLKDANEDLTRNIMSLGVERMKGDKVTNTHMRNLFIKFKLLPHDQSSIDYVNKSIQYYEESDEEENGDIIVQILKKFQKKALKRNADNLEKLKTRWNISKLEYTEKLRKYVRLLVILGIVIGAVIVIYNQYSNAKKAKAISEIKKWEKEFEEYESTIPEQYFEQKDVISDYSQLKTNIDSNVTNPQVAAFLKNSLHQYCYNLNTSDTISLSFDPIVPLPGCVPMQFSNDSQQSSVLLLLYDENNPQAKVKAKLLKKDPGSYLNTFDLYILPSERAIVVINPNLIDSKTLGPTKITSVSAFNVSFESYKLKNGKPKKDVYLSFSEYDGHDYMLTHIYETMNFKNLFKTP